MIFFLLCRQAVYAQPADSTGALPARYLQTVSEKTDKYYNQLSSKTEKTLGKLARWENKIKTLLEKTSPETAQRLFGNNQLTFAALLQRYQQGKAAADHYKSQYNEYRDKLTTSLKYLDSRTSDSSVTAARSKTERLNEQVRQTEAVQQFIKERKKQLMEQALQYLGRSKYLQKISKESYYYIEALKNYKELFSDPKKAEALAMKLLEKIPGFSDFMRRNSMLASLFRQPDGGQAGMASLAGLQTRAQVNGLIQQQLSAGGPNAMQQFQQNMQGAQAQLNELKNKILKNGGSSSDDNLAEGFKPNTQKAKTFWQRLELGANVQSQKATAFFPVTSDLALSVGYKLNDKSMIGIGASYKLGWGRGWNDIRISHQGAGLRSFVDWKIKGSFWLSGGYEMNYRPLTPVLTALPLSLSGWQQSGLVGLSKTVAVKSKFLKKTKLQLLWDFLSYEQVPRAQPLVFRVGYSF